jgi:sarcosine oxidase/L-pipecolate oxidase
MSPSATHTSHVIIGAGAFGAAAALSLAAADPSASIILIDRTPYPCPLAASHDYQKAVRADYGTKFYMDLGLKARAEWLGNPLYSQFYHPSKIIFIEKRGGAEHMVENFRELGYTSCYTSTPEAFRENHPLFTDMDFSRVTGLYVNPDAAWVEATPCIRAIIDAAVKLGVHYVEATISKLLFNDEGDCMGVQLVDGKRIIATKTILAAGANVPKILADSAPHRPDMQPGKRLSGAAVMTGVVKLTEEQAMRLKDMPIVAHRVAKSSGKSDSQPLR